MTSSNRINFDVSYIRNQLVWRSLVLYTCSFFLVQLKAMVNLMWHFLAIGVTLYHTCTLAKPLFTMLCEMNGPDGFRDEDV